MSSLYDAEAESLARLLDQVQREHLVEVLVVRQATDEGVVAQHGQADHTRRLTKHLRRPLVRHVATEIVAVRLRPSTLKQLE